MDSSVPKFKPLAIAICPSEEGWQECCIGERLRFLGHHFGYDVYLCEPKPDDNPVTVSRLIARGESIAVRGSDVNCDCISDEISTTLKGLWENEMLPQYNVGPDGVSRIYYDYWENLLLNKKIDLYYLAFITALSKDWYRLHKENNDGSETRQD